MPERLTEDGRQCPGGMPGVGRGLVVAARSPGSQPGRIGRGFQSIEFQGPLRYGRLIEGRCIVGVGALVP